MKAIIDRFEGETAILEYQNGTFHHLHKNNLPKECKEGDCLIIDGNIISIDAGEKKKRAEKITKLMNDLIK